MPHDCVQVVTGVPVEGVLGGSPVSTRHRLLRTGELTKVKGANVGVRVGRAVIYMQGASCGNVSVWRF